MKIRFVAISPHILPRVRILVDALRNASNAGNTDGMDAATEKLLALVDGEPSIDLAEDEWRKWLAGIRNTHSEFQSDYIVPRERCAEFFPHAKPETMILQLPVDEPEGDHV